jgi:hypothetical protein
MTLLVRETVKIGVARTLTTVQESVKRGGPLDNGV